jgi:hypothetical protein
MGSSPDHTKSKKLSRKDQVRRYSPLKSCVCVYFISDPRKEGITRELFALLGEKAPPISLTENKYKLKKSNRRALPWYAYAAQPGHKQN